jgi:hypothetical protein
MANRRRPNSRKAPRTKKDFKPFDADKYPDRDYRGEKTDPDTGKKTRA